MKKIMSLAIAFAATLAFVSCGSSKKAADQYYVNPVANVANSNPDGQEVRLSEAEEYALRAPGKRAAGKGVSSNESMAQQLAETEARRAFSDAIAASVTAAAKRSGFDITQYAGGEEDGQAVTDGGEKQNTLAKSVSNEIVASTVVVKKSKFYNSSNKRFTVYVCLEYDGDVAEMAKKAVQQVKQRVSDEDRIKIEYNLEKFEEEVAKDLSRGY